MPRRACLEGAIPSVIATCASDGTPNVAHISLVRHVDASHVALSFQFFNKTRENVLVNPDATVQVVNPDSAAHRRPRVRYPRTETARPLFEHMKARLAGIPSHAGMSEVFRLRGAEVYEVLHIEAVPGDPLTAPLPRRSRLAALRACSRCLGGYADLAGLLDEVMDALGCYFDIHHAMPLMVDETGGRLYTVASRCHPESAWQRASAPRIRIGHMAQEYLYSRAMRRNLPRVDASWELESEIPLPGLPVSRSQLAVPILLRERLLGVLYVERVRRLCASVTRTRMLWAHWPSRWDWPSVCSGRWGTRRRKLPVAHLAAAHGPLERSSPCATTRPTTARSWATTT